MIERRYITQPDGVRLAAEIAGPAGAPAVVFAHGGGQTRHSWSGAFHRLASEGYRVINYDARGHGESDWSPDNRYPITRRWSDMQSVLALAGRPVAVIGASMGGGTALYGVGQGFRPDALLLVDIAPNSDRAGMQRVRDFMQSGLEGFASLDEAADAVAAYNPSRPRPRDVSGLRRNLRQQTDGRWYWHWDPGMVMLDIDAERAIMGRTMEGLEAAASLPVVLIRGVNSDVVTGDTVQEFRERLPHIEVIDVEGAGHMVAGDRNDAFLAGIIGFLSKHLPAGPPGR